MVEYFVGFCVGVFVVECFDYVFFGGGLCGGVDGFVYVFVGY